MSFNFAFLSKYQGKNSTVKYFAGWEVDLANKDELTRYILTHAVDEESYKLFTKMQSGLKFFIKDNKIVKILNEDDSSDLIRIENSLFPVELPVTEWETHTLFSLEKDSQGSHYLGGNAPDDFVLPSYEKMTCPFIYIGSLDCKDEVFRWTGLDKLHLAYPIYECSYEIFLDYSNPLHPQIMNPDTFTDDWKDFVPKNVANIIYDKVPYATRQSMDVEGQEEKKPIQCGVPLWIQEPNIPVSPKNNKLMKFVCQINSDSDIKASYKDTRQPVLSDYGDQLYLAFVESGYLYIFWEPESKVLCLLAQFS